MLLGCPHPHQAAVFIKLPARRYPVLSHSSSGGLAADGRTNTIILTGKQLERGNCSMARCPSFAKLFLWAVGGATAASPSTRALGGNSEPLLMGKGGRLSSATDTGGLSLLSWVLTCLCYHGRSASSTGTILCPVPPGHSRLVFLPHRIVCEIRVP